MAGVYRWIRPLAPAAAVLLTGLVMVNVALWIYYRRTLSEMAFMTVMIWTVLVLNSALEAGQLRLGGNRDNGRRGHGRCSDRAGR